MHINPVLERDANDSVKKNYDQLKTAFNVYSLPIFFTYIGAFPEYLSYITDQLIKNLKDEKFEILITNAETQFMELIDAALQNSKEKDDWLKRYLNSPSFFYFHKDLQKIFKTNLKMCFIFIALREAIKGWAVAAKQLPNNAHSKMTPSEEEATKTQIIFQDIISESSLAVLNSQKNNDFKTTYEKDSLNPSDSRHSDGSEIVTAKSTGIEKSLLPEYLMICKNDFDDLLKLPNTLILRVNFEKFLLSYIQLFPHLIFSPINIVFQLTSKYSNFPEILYMMSEHFPTYAVQRMMFSGYMLKKYKREL